MDWDLTCVLLFHVAVIRFKSRECAKKVVFLVSSECPKFDIFRWNSWRWLLTNSMQQDLTKSKARRENCKRQLIGWAIAIGGWRPSLVGRGPSLVGVCGHCYLVESPKTSRTNLCSFLLLVRPGDHQLGSRLMDCPACVGKRM